MKKWQFYWMMTALWGVMSLLERITILMANDGKYEQTTMSWFLVALMLSSCLYSIYYFPKDK